MTNENHQDDVSVKVEPGQRDRGQAVQFNMSRRHFAKSGIAASGVILTLASKPVMGTVVCKSPSGFLSGNQSTHAAPSICMGRSPGYWKNHADNWPIPPETSFKTIFGCSPVSVYAKYTLLDLVSPKQDDVNKLGMHLVAALLNARKGWTPFLLEDKIIAMFMEWQVKGTFSPTPTVYWDASQIVNYLSATQA